MKKYTLFAGVNGAGKTSIYKSIYKKNSQIGERVNTDEMVARIGSWEDNNLQFKIAREAVGLIKYYINNSITFNQETTLSGKSTIVNIKKAKEKGFYIVMNYIGIENPEIAKARVKYRVSKGGHGIPDETIERRYYQSLNHLKEVIGICDEVNIYDNTKEFIQIAYLKNGNLMWKDDILPSWIADII